ncbi:hypothetical protein FF38_03349 [Lucilia cuprina]|uniref:Uncharacterized protein n=1 Tax=Lucilia cuprina TaxID=7375 RepID=A0A0L0C3S9_LUCCU|nr:hypothetical protein FF38_03349 [Lucilia cuprina]
MLRELLWLQDDKKYALEQETFGQFAIDTKLTSLKRLQQKRQPHLKAALTQVNIQHLWYKTIFVPVAVERNKDTNQRRTTWVLDRSKHSYIFFKSLKPNMTIFASTLQFHFQITSEKERKNCFLRKTSDVLYFNTCAQLLSLKCLLIIYEFSLS